MTIEQENEILKAENAKLIALLERWVVQYGYREPWVVKAHVGDYRLKNSKGRHGHQRGQPDTGAADANAAKNGRQNLSQAGG